MPLTPEQRKTLRELDGELRVDELKRGDVEDPRRQMLPPVPTRHGAFKTFWSTLWTEATPKDREDMVIGVMMLTIAFGFGRASKRRKA